MAANGKPGFGTRGVPPISAANPYLGVTTPAGGYRHYDAATGIDESLRAFMVSVYNIMVLGLITTGSVAYLVYVITVTGDPSLAAYRDDGTLIQMTETEYLTELGAFLWAAPVSYAVCFGPLLVLVLTAPMWRNLGPSAAAIIFMTVAVLIGVSFSGLALTYTNSSIAQMFFATAAGFGGLSLYGYTTGKDLSGWGSFLWMGLFAVIGAIIINIFIGVPAMDFAISVIGAVVFAGFTAYDTQMIKEAYSNRFREDEARPLAISGALDLYLDFINMFRFLLALFGTEED